MKLYSIKIKLKNYDYWYLNFDKIFWTSVNSLKFDIKFKTINPTPNYSPTISSIEYAVIE